jgi:hypothetical protein
MAVSAPAPASIRPYLIVALFPPATTRATFTTARAEVDHPQLCFARDAHPVGYDANSAHDSGPGTFRNDTEHDDHVAMGCGG